MDGPELWSENTDRSSTLVIAEAKPQHTGRYTVVVKDRKSSAQHTLTLSVIGKAKHTHTLAHARILCSVRTIRSKFAVT